MSLFRSLQSLRSPAGRAGQLFVSATSPQPSSPIKSKEVQRSRSALMLNAVSAGKCGDFSGVVKIYFEVVGKPDLDDKIIADVTASTGTSGD